MSNAANVPHLQGKAPFRAAFSPAFVLFLLCFVFFWVRRVSNRSTRTRSLHIRLVQSLVIFFYLIRIRRARFFQLHFTLFFICISTCFFQICVGLGNVQWVLGHVALAFIADHFIQWNWTLGLNRLQSIDLIALLGKREFLVQSWLSFSM